MLEIKFQRLIFLVCLFIIALISPVYLDYCKNRASKQNGNLNWLWLLHVVTSCHPSNVQHWDLILLLFVNCDAIVLLLYCKDLLRLWILQAGFHAGKLYNCRSLFQEMARLVAVKWPFILITDRIFSFHWNAIKEAWLVETLDQVYVKKHSYFLVALCSLDLVDISTSMQWMV